MIITNKTDTTIVIQHKITREIVNIIPGRRSYGALLNDAGFREQLFKLRSTGDISFVAPVKKDKAK